MRCPHEEPRRKRPNRPHRRANDHLYQVADVDGLPAFFSLGKHYDRTQIQEKDR